MVLTVMPLRRENNADDANHQTHGEELAGNFRNKPGINDHAPK